MDGEKRMISGGLKASIKEGKGVQGKEEAWDGETETVGKKDLDLFSRNNTRE